MNIKKIVKQYLEENGYQGLYQEDFECGCYIEDLFPCGEPNADCKPGICGKFMFEGEMTAGIVAKEVK